MANKVYDVVVSFAGEDRPFVEEVVAELNALGVRVFYDDHEVSDLWGKNLVDFLGETYGSSARLCLMFISRHYVAKEFPNLERTHAQARAMRDPGEYILPVRIDDTPVPGMPATIAYLAAKSYSASNIANLVAKKLGRGEAPSESRPKQRVAAPMPQRTRTLSDRERDAHVRDAFNDISDYFEHACEQMQREVREVEADFERIDKKTFVVKSYVDGRLVSSARIWRGGLTRDDGSICYGPGDQGHSSGSMNDWLDVQVIDGEPKLVSHMSDIFTSDPNSPMTTREAAEYLWRRFCRPLESENRRTYR